MREYFVRHFNLMTLGPDGPFFIAGARRPGPAALKANMYHDLLMNTVNRDTFPLI